MGTISHRKPTRRLSGEEIGLILKLRAEGLTQTQIAQRLDCDQANISNWLRKLTDTTDAAKSYLRGQALPMARNVVKSGKPDVHLKALQGLSVIGEDGERGGVTIIVGGDARVQVNVGGGPTEAIRLTERALSEPKE